MKISIIIPALNEEKYLKDTLMHSLGLQGDFEILVVDGGSRDGTTETAGNFKEIKIFKEIKGRARQMNRGASEATGDVFLFLHADTLLPEGTYKAIIEHLGEKENIGGSFSLKFDRVHPLLNFYCWCSRFSREFFTYGDHGIFVRKEVFYEIGGFKDIPLMEDVEIQKRLKGKGRFKKLNEAVVTSARRFQKTGILKQFVLDILLVIFFKMGVPASSLKKFYKDHF